MNKDRSLYSLKEQRPLVALAKRAKTILTGLFILVFCPLSLLLTPSCNPEAKWETEDVTINMNVTTVSAGFIECSFSTSKEAYYLVSIAPVEEGVDPMAHQKQFMMLALDSANVEYLKWRNELLNQGEFNVAPFASHALQYGAVDYFYTGLLPNRDYWIYAFVVNPETMEPAGKLYLQQITTTKLSVMDIHFAYRIKGRWDYIYPMDTLGKIYNAFPYIATTRDSITLTEDSLFSQEGAVLYFYFWCMERFTEPEKANVLYGVHAVENDGYQSSENWQEGHTYYTAICGFDGGFQQMTIYKFIWSGDSCNYYFRDTDPANIVDLYR